MKLVPSWEEIRPFVSVDTVKILFSRQGLSQAKETYARLVGTKAPAPGSVPNDSVRRLQRLCDRFPECRYLEIGVDKGITFLAIRAARKVGVDPKPRFGLPEGVAGVQILERETSDAYFAKTTGDVFDVVFIDGLHTYEQTWRDFLNSLAVAHRDTVWMIDDVVPLNVYAADPDPIAAYQRAQDAGEKVLGWQGDVFKVVLALSEVFPQFHYRTIADVGKEQTLVWLPPGTELPVPPESAWGLVIDRDYDDVFPGGQVPDVFQAVSETDAVTAFEGECGPSA